MVKELAENNHFLERSDFSVFYLRLNQPQVLFQLFDLKFKKYADRSETDAGSMFMVLNLSTESFL